MTDDDDITTEEGLDALTTVRHFNEEVFEGVDDASNNIDGCRHMAQDLHEQAERAMEAINEVQEVAHAMQSGRGTFSHSDSLDAAFEALERPYEITNGEMQQFLEDIEAALENAGETGGEPVGTVTIDGTTYEMTLTEVEEDQPEEQGGFGGYLRRRIEENDGLNASIIARDVDIDGGRIGAILNEGEEPTGEEVDNVLTYLHETGIIAEEEYEDAKTVYIDDDTLADLFG